MLDPIFAKRASPEYLLERAVVLDQAAKDLRRKKKFVSANYVENVARRLREQVATGVR